MFVLRSNPTAPCKFLVSNLSYPGGAKLLIELYTINLLYHITDCFPAKIFNQWFARGIKAAVSNDPSNDLICSVLKTQKFYNVTDLLTPNLFASCLPLHPAKSNT